MNKDINIAGILKDAPKGTKLYSSVCGECQLYSIYNNIIRCKIKGRYVLFDSKGRFGDFEGECTLFPSKGNRDWQTFKATWMYKHFEPGQKVLVPYYGRCKWRLAFYSHYDESSKHHITTDAMCFPDEEVITYKSNEDKLGKPVE